MIRDAIEKIESMSGRMVREINGVFYQITGDGYNQIVPEVVMPETLTVFSLDALVKLIKSEGIKKDNPLYVSVCDAEEVIVYGDARGEDDRYKRPNYYRAIVKDVPGWPEKLTLGFDEAMIAMRSCVEETPDSVYALTLLSGITSGAKVTYTDNGVATSVVKQSGVALQTNEKIRPIIKLKPYRTFQEVPQPESEFLIRVTEKGIMFKESDGGMWHLTARNSIKEYLEAVLEKEINDGNVIVML